MIRVVVDANVLVSAAISVGPSHRIVSAAFIAEGVTAIVCPALLAEVSSVLNRPRIQKRLLADRAVAFLDDLVTLLDVVADPSNVEPETRDPKDDYLVALAAEHGVDFIVSGDKDLLEWEGQSPPVMAPAAFWNLLESAGR
ncbi:MAG: putative toxin-antitoxin system toxin component, PIN family [Hyphomicrobiales bacterium]|nr:putative toxin-antitoxin system toxin component, PIN family [Actinomycetes bacterium]MCP4073944.1 putative toxin-antitoxin system toxin component, PIN family [Hyphomicrobiales bacterium]